jgi:hypothetical protein
MDKANRTELGWQHSLNSSPYNKSELSPIKIVSASGKESFVNLEEKMKIDKQKSKFALIPT